MDIKCSALLLRSVRHLGQSCILQVLTVERGLISLFANQRIDESLKTPFFWGEWVFHDRGQNLHHVKEASALELFENLKQNYASLTTAGQMARLLLQTQLPEKKADGAVALSLSYFRQLEHFEDPAILLASFQLKLLAHEGLLYLSPVCNRCGARTSHLFHGESVCTEHAPAQSHPFCIDQEGILLHCRTFSELKRLSLTAAVVQKINCITNELTM